MFKQVKPFTTIFFIELWERFGFYGMQAILVYYMVKAIGMTDTLAFNTYSAFTALIYAAIFIGGYLGDNILGAKKTLLLGAVFLTLGYVILGYADPSYLYIALGVIIVGNGLFKANPSSLLSKLYSADDPRLDSAFTLYYMSINIGSLVSMSLVPAIADHFGWGTGFYVCALGLILAIAKFLTSLQSLQPYDSPVGKKPLNFSAFIMVVIGAVISVFVLSYIIRHLTLAHWILSLTGLGLLAFFIFEIARAKVSERSKMIVALILMIQGIFFFILYQQMPTSLNFYAINNVEHSIFGFAINPLSFQALNPFWIFVMSPLLAHLYHKLGKQGKDLKMPTKFMIGMFLCAAGFLILWSSRYFANNQGIVSSFWIITSYFFQSTGELLVSGLGLAMVAQLVPERLTGFLMGAWFMAVAIGMILGGMVAGLTDIPSNLPVGIDSLNIYSEIFLKIGIVTAIIAVVMLLMTPKLKNLMSK